MIRFPIPDLQAEYKSNPAHYICKYVSRDEISVLLDVKLLLSYDSIQDISWFAQYCQE